MSTAAVVQQKDWHIFTTPEGTQYSHIKPNGDPVSYDRRRQHAETARLPDDPLTRAHVQLNVAIDALPVPKRARIAREVAELLRQRYFPGGKPIPPIR